jgi:transcriptional regulator with XRE-family HTH domain
MGVLVSGLHEEPYQRFIKLLSSAHRESGLSLRELSDRSAIPGATLLSILRGRSFPPGLGVVHALIKALGVSPPREKAILEAYDRAVNSSSSFVSGDHRTGSAVISAVTQEHQANATMIRGERAPYFINGAGEKAEADSSGPPPLIADVDGYDGRPNPLTAATKAEFVAALRAFWQWAGAPSARKVANRHFSIALLNEAVADLVNAHARLDISQAWGDGTAVVADGTHMDTYLNNLLAETSVRHGKPGGIAYHHISDTYIALFTHFIPCGYGRPSTSSRACSRTPPRSSPPPCMRTPRASHCLSSPWHTCWASTSCPGSGTGRA